MGWLDANEYLMLETLGAERVEDIYRAANAPRGDADEPALRTPRRYALAWRRRADDPRPPSCCRADARAYPCPG